MIGPLQPATQGKWFSADIAAFGLLQTDPQQSQFHRPVRWTSSTDDLQKLFSWKLVVWILIRLTELQILNNSTGCITHTHTKKYNLTSPFSFRSFLTSSLQFNSCSIIIILICNSYSGLTLMRYCASAKITVLNSRNNSSIRKIKFGL